MYSSWSKNQTNNAFEKETEVTNKRKVIIIGGGPNRLVKELSLTIVIIHSSLQ